MKRLLVPASILAAAVGGYGGATFLADTGQPPVKHAGVVWSTTRDSIAEMGPVPEGCTWDVRAAGVSTEYGPESEYMLELITPADDGTCCYRIPLARAYRAIGTPALALNRSIVLHAGESLGARAWLRGGEGKGYKIAVDAAFYESCTAVPSPAP